MTTQDKEDLRTMKAYRMLDWGRALLCDVPVPQPKAGEVRLRVGGNGLCMSDIHALDRWGASPPTHLDIALPMTMGHEIAGWIDALGPGVSGWAQGQSCVVTAGGCGHCRRCAEGWNNYCPFNRKFPGLGEDGGLAEYMVVPQHYLVSAGSLEPWQAAPLTDAGLSSYHAVKRVTPLLLPGSTVLVIGVGGLGHIGIAALKAITTARIIAIDPRKDALQLGAEQGADVCLDSRDLTPLTILDHGGRVDAVLDFVGTGDTMKLAAGVIRPHGHIVVVGRGSGVFEMHSGALPYGAMLSTTIGGSKGELMEVIALAEAGRLPVHLSRHTLDEVPEMLDKLRRGEILGRAVIVPQAS